MIKTKSIYTPIEEEDGLRVLITRYYPRGVKREKYDIWVRVLAPSEKLLKQYKNSEIDWNNFKNTLLSELRNSVDSVNAIHKLQSKSNIQNITLLCYEKDDRPCHRYMVKALIEKPMLPWSNLISENANDHETTPMDIHVANKEYQIIS